MEDKMAAGTFGRAMNYGRGGSFYYLCVGEIDRVHTYVDWKRFTFEAIQK